MNNQYTFLMKPKVDFCFKELMEDAEIHKGFISAFLFMTAQKAVYSRTAKADRKLPSPGKRLVQA